MKTTEKTGTDKATGKASVNIEGLNSLLYEALETELGGVKVYEAAIESAIEDDLREEWQEYLEQTRHHVEVLQEVFETLGLDADAETPGREIVRSKGEALIAAIELARKSATPEAAQIVAAECVVDAETKDHMNWELIGIAAASLKSEEAEALKKAHDEVEDEEDEHLYHTAGWTRELWIQALGLPSVLPPPEEEKDVKTAIAAAKAKKERKSMLPTGGASKSAKATKESAH